MATPSRTSLINRTLRVLKKHFTPVIPSEERSLFEHLMFACLLENSPYDAAEQVFASMENDYFDWNELRVSTIRELTEVTKPLVDPAEAAARLKQTLHAVFESVYQFDLETLKKQNIGQAAKQLEKLNGSTPFVVAYATQMALGGHSIPVNRGLLVAMQVIGVISESEAKHGTVPGLERAVSKNKGIESGSMLHQLGVEVGRSPYGQTARKLLLEIAPDCKSRLPKRETQRGSAAAAAAAADAAAQATPAKDGQRKKPAKAGATGAPAHKPEPAKADKKKPPTKRPAPAKPLTKSGKKATTKKKTTSRKLAKRKPR
jgi:endonuclease-3